jgi:hypothetical protein
MLIRLRSLRFSHLRSLGCWPATVGVSFEPQLNNVLSCKLVPLQQDLPPELTADLVGLMGLKRATAPSMPNYIVHRCLTLLGNSLRYLVPMRRLQLDL